MCILFLPETSYSKISWRKKKEKHDSHMNFVFFWALYVFLQLGNITFIVFSLLQCPKGKTALYQFVKVQDPDNSSQTVYDSWIKANGSPRVSCNRLLITSFSEDPVSCVVTK